MQGLAPAVAVLMVLVAWDVFKGDGGGRLGITIGIAAVSWWRICSRPHRRWSGRGGLAGVVLLR